MSGNDFTCAQCGGQFTKARPDEEALAEMEHYFGEVPEEERAIICGDCFQNMHPLKHPERVAAARRNKR